MSEADLTELSAKLAGGSRLGGRRRRRAAERLAALGTPQAMRALAQAYGAGTDNRVAAIAERALAGLDDPAAVDEVCNVSIETGDERLAALVEWAGHRHSDPAMRALQLFLAGDFDAYAELDFDGSLLRSARASAGEALRARLAERARESGRLEWVRAVTTDRSPGAMAVLSDEEWEATRALLVDARRWEELWRLALDAPPVRAAELLRELGASGWRPTGEPDRADYAALVALAEECARHPVVRALTKPPREIGKSPPRLRMTPDGSLLIAGDDSGEITLWRLPTGEPAGRIDAGSGTVTTLAVSPDGSLLASAGGGTGRLWRLPSGEPASGPLDFGFVCDKLAFSPDGQRLVSAGTWCPIRLWRLPSGEPVRELEWTSGLDSLEGEWTPRLDSLVISPDGTLIAAATDDLIRLWRLPSGEHVTDISNLGYVDDIAITPDGRLLVGGLLDGAPRLWRLPSGEPAGTLTGHDVGAVLLAITPDGALLATGGIDDGSVRLWHLPSGEPAGVLHPPDDGSVNRLAVTPDGRLLVSADYLGSARLWHLPSGEPAGVITADKTDIVDFETDIDRFAVTPGGELLASSGEVGPVQVWLPMIVAPARTPVGRIGLPDVERLRSRLGRSEAERPWIELISLLVARRHRHDIEAADAEPGRGPGAADIEVDPDPSSQRAGR